MTLTSTQEIASSLFCSLRAALTKLRQLKDGEAVIKQGVAFGDLHNDTEIKADKILGEFLTHHPKGFSLREVRQFTVEGFGEYQLHEDDFGTWMINPMDPNQAPPPEGLWVTIDPLDGSLDFQTRGPAQGLPYSACITVLKRRDGATFDDVVAAGVIDLRNGDCWVSSVDDTGQYHTLCYPAGSDESVSCTTVATDTLNLGSQIVIGEFYYPENREKLARAFAGKKGWLRNPGSAAYEMALIGNGTAVAFICDRQKQHELGAGYALTKGAGGVAVDFEGKDLGTRSYDFKTQTPVILAANMRIAEQILTLLQTHP
jgi:fructose-1,6-bisphosphatase/inositol monophosphatase family enzyme